MSYTLSEIMQKAIQAPLANKGHTVQISPGIISA